MLSDNKQPLKSGWQFEHIFYFCLWQWPWFKCDDTFRGALIYKTNRLDSYYTIAEWFFATIIFMYQGSLSYTIGYIAHLCKSSCHWFSYSITTLGSLIWPRLYKREEKQDQTWKPGYEPSGIKSESSKIQWLHRVHADNLSKTVTACYLVHFINQYCHNWKCLSVDVTYRFVCESGVCIDVFMNHGSSCQVMIGLLSDN